ncbi:MAG: DUF192 domain-containing protein [Caulobacteraceae bacterium]
MFRQRSHAVASRLAACILALGAVLAAPALAIGASAPAAAPRGLSVVPLSVFTAKGDFRFLVQVAADDASRERGLMFRRHLAANRGMLFDFKTPQEVAFWMKNTFIPLDMLFVDADGRIVSIARNAQPFSETPIPSAGPVRAVIEIAGGRAAEIGAEPGDEIKSSIFAKGRA